MGTLLVLSVGRTDVQLVTNNARQELDQDRCGELHDQIEQRIHDWMLVDAPANKTKPVAKELPDGEFQLCTPKADAVLNYLDNDLTSIKVLILETCRKTKKNDPRYAGRVVEGRLKEKGVSDIARCAYLQENDEDYDDRTNEKDAILRRDVVRRIEEAVRLNISSDIDSVLLATTGGPPPITSLIGQIVRLHSQKAKCEIVEVEDGARQTPPIPDKAILRTIGRDPDEPFRAKRHAFELITKGNLLAAWGAVSHLHDDPDEQPWTQVINWLADFAASMPLPAECDIDVLNHPKRAVRAALRVEFALRARDIPRAIHGTVAFFESALWDHLDLHITPKDNTPQCRLYQVKPEPESKLIRQEGATDNMKRPFKLDTKTEGRWFNIYDDKVCGIQLAMYYLKKPNLTKLGQAVSEEIRNLRNDVVHEEPTPELMKVAREQMEQKKLWKDNQFLQQPLVSDVLEELGVSNPASLCDDLINTVLDRLLSPSTNPSR